MITLHVKTKLLKDARRLLEEHGILVVGFERTIHTPLGQIEHRFGADPAEWDRLCTWFNSRPSELSYLRLSDATDPLIQNHN